MVCFLLFARPVLLRLGGFAWRGPDGGAAAGRIRLDQAGRAAANTCARRWCARPHGRLQVASHRARGLRHPDLDGRGRRAWSSSDERVERVEPGEPVPFLSFAELGIPA